MIELRNLTKKFGEFLAVNNISLKVEKGEIYGFVGPNGAGKTTTIKMMTGLLKPTSGEIYIANINLLKEPYKAKQEIGFIPDKPYIYEKLTGYEFLKTIGTIYNLERKELEKRIEFLFEFLDLSLWKDELIEYYSHGMKQKIVIASALIHSPKVLIIDEPIVGLDPKSVKLLKSIFIQLKQKGVSIFISTHTLSLVEEICDRIGIISSGRILAEGSLEDLKAKVKLEKGNLEEVFLKILGERKDSEELLNLYE